MNEKTQEYPALVKEVKKTILGTMTAKGNKDTVSLAIIAKYKLLIDWIIYFETDLNPKISIADLSARVYDDMVLLAASELNPNPTGN